MARAIDWLKRMPVIKQFIRNGANLETARVHLAELSALTHQIAAMAFEHTRAMRLAEPRYQGPKRLNRHEWQIYSQNGEDGVLAEIFRRIGTTNRTFVELGAGDGSENNTVALLVQGWRGCWLEADARSVEEIQQNAREWIGTGALAVRGTRITAENVNATLASLGVPEEPDLLSIDIDGNDYWVWRALTIRPRVLVIEYNAIFRPPLAFTIRYDPDFMWEESSYHGASLSALERLGNELGYRLVGCEMAGVNAFFVRADACGDHFEAPFTAEHHFEPPRFDFLVRRAAHRPQPGPYTAVS